MKIHAARKQNDSATLCGELLYVCARGAKEEQVQIGVIVLAGGVINCPDCRTIINHIRANITEHGYRYVPI